MKIAVSAQQTGLEAPVSPIFGRCPFFVLVEVEKDEIKLIKSMPNTAAQQLSAAGITAAQLIANEQVQVIITGSMGPRAFQVFNQLNIKVFGAIPGTVKDNVKAFIQGKLKELEPGPFRGFGFGQGFGKGWGFGRGRNI